MENDPYPSNFANEPEVPGYEPDTPKTEPLLELFEYKTGVNIDTIAHVRATFKSVAETVCDLIPGSPERTIALRKLLEAKDAAMRGVCYYPYPEDTQKSSEHPEDTPESLKLPETKNKPTIHKVGRVY